MSAIMIFPSESSWGSIYSVFGIVIFVIGISKITKRIKMSIRLLIVLFIFISSLSTLIFTDYINVKRNNEAPMIRTTTLYLADDNSDLVYYDTPFYDVINCHINDKNSKFNIVKNKNYSHEELFDYCSKK